MTGRHLLLGLLMAGLQLSAQTLDECVAHRRHGELAESRSCFAGLAASANPYLRAEGLWGLERYQEANDQFRGAVERNPKNADYKVRWGRLFLERFNRQEAAKLFQEALSIEPEHPGALLGLALVASGGFESKAVELAEKAVSLDPKLVEARELLARLALEDADPKQATIRAEEALAIAPNALQAMAIRATIDWMDDKEETPWIDRILSLNPVYGEAYATAGYFFVLNRRYEEGIRFYRKAIELNPRLWEARAELGVNLMRVGQDAEAKEHLELCYESGYRDAATVNSLRLLDSYENFRVLKGKRIVLKLHKEEAELLRPYFEAELERAIRTFEEKYKFRLEQPVVLEVYPDHEDFAVRTMGMPGLGALGVTFGHVVAMDSPSARSPGSFHWASTVWHELSHVIVLAATRHRVPRWFAEGMAVHEETAVSPDWGDRLSPDVIRAIKDEKLLPLAQLERGFVRPTYPGQPIVSYFQAGRTCDYIMETWDYQKLLDMMNSFAQLKTTAEVVQEHLGLTTEEFDARFFKWLNAQTQRTVEGFAEWTKRLRAIAEHADRKDYDYVIREGLEIRDIYPDYVEGANVYEFLAEAYLAKGETDKAVAQLERYSNVGGRNLDTVKKLASLLEEQGRKKDAAAALNRLNYVYPLDEDLHRKLGDLLLAEGNAEGAIREYEALVALDPLDQAASHFSLAKAYKQANKNDRAWEHVLLALEAAPGYRPAQSLLLELDK